MKNTTTIQLDSILFWKMYNALREAEDTLWRCDGETNPENEDLVEEIAEMQVTINKVLDRLEPIVSSLKDIDTKSN